MLCCAVQVSTLPSWDENRPLLDSRRLRGKSCPGGLGGSPRSHSLSRMRETGLERREVFTEGDPNYRPSGDRGYPSLLLSLWLESSDCSHPNLLHYLQISPSNRIICKMPGGERTIWCVCSFSHRPPQVAPPGTRVGVTELSLPLTRPQEEHYETSEVT